MASLDPEDVATEEFVLTEQIYQTVWFSLVFCHLVCNYTVITHGVVCTGCSCLAQCGFLPERFLLN